MRWLFSLSRLSFICNIFFVLAITLQLIDWNHNQDITATIGIIGYVMVVILNPLVNLCYLVLGLRGKKFWKIVPAWLVTANFLFLIMQFIFILYLNDTKHT